ncbi:MAG: hypothetical protein J5865_02310 [Lachnospiraceae bacterium]|nr:hypothetical protein [Lachnospiraceae bacterium]
MKKHFIWTINALALLTASTAMADETTSEAAETAVRETARVGGLNTEWILWALLIGFLIALLVTAAWKAQLKSVRAKWEAYDYVRRDSLDLRSNNERFLYRNIQKVPVPKPQNNQSGQGGMAGPGGTIHFGGSAGGMSSSGGTIHFGGTAGAHGNTGGHSGFTLGGGQGSNVRPGSNSGGGLNYGGHIKPGGRPSGRGPSRPE